MRNGKNHVQKLTAFLLSLCLLIGCFAEGGSIQARAAEVPAPEKEALCSDAYYTKIQNNAVWEADEAVDACPDIVVPLQEGELELVFNRAKSYLPYLKSGSRSFSLPELFPRSGDGAGEMPDRINRYSSVKMVENTAARTVVLWRYAPQFPKDANINLVPFDGFVDEYFVIYPDGMVYRTARKGTPNVDDFYAESNLIRKSYRMTAEGVQENELSEPKAAVGTGYTDVASTDGTVTVSSVRSGAPEILELTVSAGTSSALIVERWGKADVASIQKNGTPLTAHTDYETGHVVEFDSERLVIWFAEPLQKDDMLTVVPGSFTMPANRPAVVDAGADQSIIAETFPVTISLKGGVEDDGINPVTLQWTVTDGEGRNVNINAADQLETSAVVSAAGAYDITLTVNDGTPISDTMHVLIREPLKPMGTPKVNFTFNDGTGSATKEEVTGKACEITGDKPYWRAGIAGTALELNGYSSSVVLPAEKAPAIQDQLTVEAWTAVSAFPWSWAPIVHHSTWERKNPNDLTNPNNYRLTKGYYLGVNSHLQAGMMIMTANAGLQELLVPENTMTYSRWTYLVGTYDGQSMKIYIDGELAASKDVPNGGAIVLPDNQDLIVGKGIPMVPTECFAKRFETDFGYEGAVDEVRVYDQTMDAERISMQYRLDKPSNHLIRCPDLADRHLPKVATGKADSFGAVSTTLEHSECWDGRWRLSDDADIVVQFEDTPMKLVFWHGDGYIPCQVTENGIWYTNEFNETWNDEGCNEPMSDKHCRFNQARIIENTDSRVVVHWRYPLMSSKQNFTGRNNDGYWVDEYYYCYPDGTIIRRDKLQADANKNVANLKDFEWQETIVINDAYTYAGENVNKRNAYSVGTLRQGKPQSIQIANTTSELKPYIIVQPDGCTIEPWRIDQWNHWPVGDVICDARPIKSPERISHSTLSSVKWNSFFELNPTEHYGIKISMVGLTDQTPDKLIPLGRSWLYPAETAIDNGTIRYAMDQKAFIAEEFTSEKMQISFHANQDTPLMNPTVILSNWTYGTDPVIRVNGNQLKEGKDYRLSAVTNRSGEKDLILWLNFKSEAFTLLTINCNEPSGTFPVLVKAETGGTITTDPAGKEITAGENLKITFKPDEGYEVLSADINGELVNLDENGEYVIENVREMVMVHGVFRRIGTAPEMLLHYTMEDNVEDVSGRNNNGTATDLTYVEGKAGKAAVFNGDSSKIGLPDLNELPVFTVAAWVMPNRAKPQFQAILSSSAEWGKPGTLQFDYRGDAKKYIFSVSGNKGGYPLAEDMVAGSTSEINEWTHVAVSYDAEAKLGKLYINGELSTITNFTEAVPVNGNNLVIGEWGVYPNDPRILKGMIDDMRLYSGILTDEEIAELVVGKEKPEPPVPAEKPAVLEARWTMDQEESGKIKDETGNGHDATAHDLTLVPGIEGKAAASFNGTTTYLETGIDGEFEDISVSLWVRPKQFPASRQFATMLGTTAWKNKDLQFTYNADGLVQFAVNGNEGGWPAKTDLAPDRRIRTGEWVHLAFVYDSSSGTAQAYVNGKLEKEQTFTSAVPINMGKFNIGKWGSIEERFMNGELDDIHIYRGLLTAEEIQNIVQTKVYPITLHAGGTKTDVPVEAVCGSEVAIVVSEIPSGKMIASVKAVGDGQELPLQSNGNTYTFTMPNAPVDVTISIKPFDKAELSNLLDYASRLTQDDVGAENWNKLQQEIRAGRNVLWDSEATMHEISQSIHALEAIVGKVYTLTVTGGTGSGVYAANDSVTVEPESREGWHFKEWSAENLSLTEEQTAAEKLTFEMPQNDVSLTAHFEELTPITYEPVDEKAATCTEAGMAAHFRGSDGKLYVKNGEQYLEKTADELVLPALDHTYGAPTYTWSANNSVCTAKRVCGRNAAHTETAEADVTAAVSIKPTATEKGEKTFTATFKEDWAKQQVKKVELPIDAAAALVKAKTDAKTELQAYRETLKNSAYRAAQITELDSKLAAGKAAIDEAADQAAVKTALEAAKTALDAVKTDAELDAEEAEAQDKLDTAAAKAVDNKIAAIGKVTLDRENAIKAARAAYEELSETAKAKVTKLGTLTAAEAELKRLQEADAQDQKDTAAAKAVDEKIGALGTITLNSKKAIEEARAAYDGLNDNAKKKVTGLDTLTAAEAELKRLQEAEAQDKLDTAAAKAVDEKIGALGTITLNSKAAVEEARAAYDGLNDNAKAKVQNLDVLKAAEAKLAELQALPETPSVHIPGNPVAPNKPETELELQVPFVDVAEDSWYYESVKQAFAEGLLDGMDASHFAPNGTLTIAQTIKLAAALHQRDKTGKVTLENGKEAWFSTYVDYAVHNGIVDKAYAGYNLKQMNTAVDRSEFVKIFFGAMPEYEYQAWNEVKDNAIPDVKSGDENAREIYTFYRAGILTGSDGKGTFYPDSNIKRSEVAAILIRMFDKTARQEVTLK